MKLKPTGTPWHALFRALQLRFDWFYGLALSSVTGQSDDFNFGFTTLSRNPLLKSKIVNNNNITTCTKSLMEEKKEVLSIRGGELDEENMNLEEKEEKQMEDQRGDGGGTRGAGEDKTERRTTVKAISNLVSYSCIGLEYI